jgi:hypothetical protein
MGMSRMLMMVLNVIRAKADDVNYGDEVTPILKVGKAAYVYVGYVISCFPTAAFGGQCSCCPHNHHHTKFYYAQKDSMTSVT